MKDDYAKQLALDLLEHYCPCQILDSWQLGVDACQPVFIDDIWWHAIYIEKAGSIPESPVLKGRDTADLVQQMHSALEHGCQLVSALHDGKRIVVKLDDGSGAAEEFMLKCAVCGLAR